VADVLAHRVEGVGEPLLLLNGGMMSFGAWEPCAARLRERHQVVRCDFRGQLLSPGTPPARMEGHADDVVRLLDRLGLGRVHLLGASFGAYVALLLAALRPVRVASVIAVTVTDFVGPEMEKGGETLRFACRDALAGGEKAKVYDLIVRIAYSPAWQEAKKGEIAARRGQASLLPAAWFEGLVGLLDALTGLDLRPHLPGIRCPVLVVAAGEDAVMPREGAEAVARAIPGASLAVLPGSGHAVIVERETEFMNLATGFLARLAARAGATP